MNKIEKKKISGWKWAFFILLALNMCVIIYVASLLNPSSASDTTISEEASIPENTFSGQTINALITLGNEDLEALLAYALSENSSNGEVPRITVSEEVTVTGALEIFGFPVEYEMTAEPFAVEDGHLQLKVSEVALGRLSLPIKQVLQLLSSQMDPNLPLLVDADANLITVELSKVKTETIKSIRLEKIEKELAEYTFNITIAKENLLQ